MTFHSSSQGGPPSFERLRPCLFLFLNSCCCGYLGLHLGTFEVQGRQLTPIIWVCETSSLAPPEIEPHEHKRVLYFDDVRFRRGEIYLSAHAFPAFLGYCWFWMSNIKVARWDGLKILIPRHKSKIGLLEQIWAQNPYDAFFGSPCTCLGQKKKNNVDFYGQRAV